nr:acyltransferase family protein [uncultured Oscillibacter sp.]
MESTLYTDNQSTSAKHIFSLDAAKFICALLVIIIHTRPFSKLFQYLKRIVVIYIGWSVVYALFQLPQWYQGGWWGKQLIKDYAASFLLSGSYYHLWYLLALIYALPCLYLLLTVVSVRKLRMILPVLWLVECLLYSYSWIGIDSIPALAWLNGHFSIIFDAVFRAIPLLGVGILCIEDPEKLFQRLPLCTVFSVFICAAEASILHFCTANSGRYSYILFTPVMTYFLLRRLLSSKKSGSSRVGTLCRKSSLVIYCLHPLILGILKLLGVESAMLLWILVTLITVFLALFWVIAKTRMQEKKASVQK